MLVLVIFMSQPGLDWSWQKQCLKSCAFDLSMHMDRTEEVYMRLGWTPACLVKAPYTYCDEHSLVVTNTARTKCDVYRFNQKFIFLLFIT